MKFLDWLSRAFPRPRAMKQFARRLVEDPGYAAQLDDILKQRGELLDKASAAAAPNDGDIPRFVRDLMSPNELSQKIARIMLEKAGVRAKCALLAALDDPKCTWQTDKGASFGSPAERVCDWLWALDCAELSDKIGHLAGAGESAAQQSAIRALVASGTVEVLPLALAHLAGLEQGNADAVEEGADAAIRRGVADPRFLQGLVEWAERNILHMTENSNQWAITIFVEHGGDRAVRVLQSESILSLANDRNVHYVLDALNQKGVVLPRSLLTSMIEKSMKSEGQWPWEWVFQSAVANLAFQDPAAARQVAEAGLHSKSRPQRSASLAFIRKQDGLPRLLHVDPPPGHPLSQSDRDTLEKLLLVVECTGQIGNGGLSQYFFNGSGDRWPQAVEALRFIGDEEAASALANAARIIHPAGASTDRGERQKQYAALSEQREAELDELDGIFGSDRMDLVELRYMQAHKEFYHKLIKARRDAGLDEQ